jgi:thioredoxin 1
MSVIDIDDTNFTDELAAADAAIVDFYAGWCGPCVMFAPIYKAIAKDYPHVRFFKLNGEKAPEARKTVKIPGLPYFAVYKNGEWLEGVATSKEGRVKELIEKHFGAAS